jgi:hypothetical protein
MVGFNHRTIEGRVDRLAVAAIENPKDIGLGSVLGGGLRRAKCP